VNPLDAWIDELARELDVDPAAVDRQLLLDVARDAAHGVARPAAPLTTYLVGLAAGLRGGGAPATAAAAATAQRLAIARTARVSLHPVDVREAERIRDGRSAASDRWAAGYPFEGDRRAVTAFLAASAAHGEQRPFGYYRIVRLEDDLTVGGIGFKGRPDPEGSVEVGFGLIEEARGHGYAREALSALLLLAREHGVRVVRADTTLENVASRRTLLGAGFVEQPGDDEVRHYRLDLPVAQATTRSAPA
jgi:RimJ/RimL family protein N-acetyltransferase